MKIYSGCVHFVFRCSGKEISEIEINIAQVCAHVYCFRVLIIDGHTFDFINLNRLKSHAKDTQWRRDSFDVVLGTAKFN